MKNKSYEQQKREAKKKWEEEKRRREKHPFLWCVNDYAVYRSDYTFESDPRFSHDVYRVVDVTDGSKSVTIEPVLIREDGLRLPDEEEAEKVKTVKPGRLMWVSNRLVNDVLMSVKLRDEICATFEDVDKALRSQVGSAFSREIDENELLTAAVNLKRFRGVMQYVRGHWERDFLNARYEHILRSAERVEKERLEQRRNRPLP